MDTTVTVGQFAVSQCAVKVKTATDPSETFSNIADLEEVTLTIEANTETWYSIAEGGWQNALLTGKALTGSFSGKRCLGDAGNDFIEGLRYAIGKDAEADFEIDFPDGSKLEFTAVVALTDVLGAATDVTPLSGDLTGKGKPTFTPAE